MSIFRFKKVEPLVPLAETQVEGKRWYVTPYQQCYPSMTTVLDATTDKSALKAWRERVGEAEAERVSAASREVGTEMHANLERFLLGDPMVITSERSRLLMRCMLPVMARIDEIRHIEAPLYSDTLRLAGRTDLIAEFDGGLSVID